MEKIRIGFLVDQMEVDWHTFDLIEFVEKNKDNFYDPLILTGYKHITKKNFLKKFINFFNNKGLKETFNFLLNWFPRKLIINIELKKVKNKFPNYSVKKNIDILELKKIDISGSWSKNKVIFRPNNESLERLRKLNFDLIIRCGSGILRGEILTLPTMGILSFHHGDNRVNRGGPSGFWEVLFNQPSSGFIIQQLTEALDNGNILYRGNIMTSNLWLMNNASLIEKSQHFMKKVLINISRSRTLIFEDKIYPENPTILKDNTFLIFWKYIIKIYGPIIISKLYAFIFGQKVVEWNIAFKKEKNFESPFNDYIRIRNPSKRFLADPFLLKHKEKNICFVEDFLYSEKKGRISAIQLNGTQYKFLDVVLEENFHLSYPYVFKDNNEIYMVPETHAIREIRLYKNIEFPLKWKLEKILKKNINAVDTSIFKKDDRWYMLTNICSSNMNDHNSELHIFHSEDLTSDRWLPINCGNPVIFDSMSARNGGLFISENNFFRINQIHAKGHYGKKFGINLIEEINENNYIERRIKEISKISSENIYGTHHFHSNENYNVVDFAEMKLISKK